MKKLKDVILEKLIITSKSTLAKRSINTFGEFVDVVNDTINMNLKIENVQYLSKDDRMTIDDLKNMSFIELTDDKDENRYVDNILSSQDKTNFIKYYCIKTNAKGYVFNYINIKIKNGSTYDDYRIGFINGSNYKDIDKVRIFKIKQ